MSDIYVQMEKSRVLGKLGKLINMPNMDVPDHVILQTLQATARPKANKYAEWMTAFEKWYVTKAAGNIPGTSEKFNADILKLYKDEADRLRIELIGE